MASGNTCGFSLCGAITPSRICAMGYRLLPWFLTTTKDANLWHNFQCSTIKQKLPRICAHPGLPHRFLGGFYRHFDLIAEDIISRKKGWSILIHGRFFTIKRSGATREIILQETIGGIDGFSGLQQRRKVRI